MIDITQFNIHNAEILYLLHGAFTTIISILMLNFLIALFSNAVAEVSEDSDLIVTIQRLSVVLTVDRRFRWIGKLLGYEKLLKRNFIMENGQVYIVTMTQEFRSNSIK